MTMEGARIENENMHRQRLESANARIIELLKELLVEIKALKPPPDVP